MKVMAYFQTNSNSVPTHLDVIAYLDRDSVVAKDIRFVTFPLINLQ